MCVLRGGGRVDGEGLLECECWGCQKFQCWRYMLRILMMGYMGNEDYGKMNNVDTGGNDNNMYDMEDTISKT